jgi:hypothetical protein
MKSRATAALPPARAAEASLLGHAVSRLRLARNIKQDTAARAGLSRNTHTGSKKAIPESPSATSCATSRPSRPESHSWIFAQRKRSGPALTLQERERRHRVRNLTAQELKELDF